MPINKTLYQLYAEMLRTILRSSLPPSIVTIPDLLNYWLSGNIVCEFTNATTTQMVDPIRRTWAVDLLEHLDLPVNLPARIVEPWI